MISAVVITKDEEANIGRCLQSLSWVSDIVVVDAHSGDKTRDIARKYTDKVIERDWQGFGPSKNFGISLAENEWIFSIDADEVVSPELRDEILGLDLDGSSVDGYFIPRLLYFCGKPVRHGGCYPDFQLRLFRKGKGKFEDIPVHEKVVLDGESGYLKNDLLHFSYNTMFEYWERFNIYTELDAKKKFERKKRFSFFSLFVLPWELFRRLILKLGILDGIPGIFYHVFSAVSSFVKYAKLWERVK